MRYADYSFYASEYIGDLIPEEAFERCAVQASQFIDYYTMGKAKENDGMYEIKMACCALAEQYYAMNKAQEMASNSFDVSKGKEVQSESVGSYSRTFRSGSETAAAAINAMTNSQPVLSQIARQYLARTGLLYRGGCSCTLHIL